MSKRRMTADQVYAMEDSEYRDLMRADLARARKSYGVKLPALRERS